MSHPKARTFHLLAALTVLIALGCSDSSSSRIDPPSAPPAPGDCQPSPIPGRLLVDFVSTATEAEARAVVEDHGLAVLRVGLGFSAGLEHRWMLVGVPVGSEDFWIRELAKSPLVVNVEQEWTLCAF